MCDAAVINVEDIVKIDLNRHYKSDLRRIETRDKKYLAKVSSCNRDDKPESVVSKFRTKHRIPGRIKEPNPIQFLNTL